MLTYLRHGLTGLLILLPLGLVAATEDLVVHDAWIREAPPNAIAMAGYATIENHGDAKRGLVGAESSGFRMVELHRSIREDGVAKMVPQDSMPIPAGGTLVLKPGDYHLMMMHPTHTLHAGDTVELTLSFDDGTQQQVAFEVRKGSGEPHEHHHHH